VYVTVDLDVLDPSLLPGTGTPEPGGVTFQTLQNWLVGLRDCQIVGWDVMELSPQLDPTYVSSIVSAKVVRTLLLSCSKGHGIGHAKSDKVLN
jgi:agmatinase